MTNNLKFSIITVSYNSEETIRETIDSLLRQDYTNVELIFVDGNSSDNTFQIINEYRDELDVIISEDDRGMYDALNKGILLATGDVVGILNSDDVFTSHKTLSLIAKEFGRYQNVSSLIGDVAIEKNGRIRRYYSSKNWKPSYFKFGLMPAHPSFFCKRELFFLYGLYNSRFTIAGDFELLLRFLLVHNVTFKYVPIQVAVMKTGGLSSFGLVNLFKVTKEIRLAFEINAISSNYCLLMTRYLHKIFQYRFVIKVVYFF